LNLTKYRKPPLKEAHRIEFLKKILLKTMVLDRLGKRFRFLNLDLSVEEKYLAPLKQEKKYFMEWIHWDTPDKILRKEVKFQISEGTEKYFNKVLVNSRTCF
jgi:hypothetical protein